jgi:hypothetical protein
VAEDAPFHGFTIFLDKGAQACIVFEIHIRIQVGDPPRREPPPLLSLGHATAWQIRASGSANNTEMENLTTAFSNRLRNSEIDDGSVELITPASEAKESEQIYRLFLQHLRFW